MEAGGDEEMKGDSAVEPHPTLVPVTAMLVPVEAVQEEEEELGSSVGEVPVVHVMQVAELQQQEEELEGLPGSGENVLTPLEPEEATVEQGGGVSVHVLTEGEMITEEIVGEVLHNEEDMGQSMEVETMEEQEQEEEDTQVCVGSLSQNQISSLVDSCQEEPEVYSCIDCAATFDQEEGLNSHMVAQHGQSGKAFLCTEPGCDETFSRTDYLHKHLRAVHKLSPSVSPDKLEKQVVGTTAGETVFENEATDADEQEEGETLTITEVSSLLLPMATNLKDKRYKCTNTGCDAEYNALEHLHRHLSRGHTSEMQLPVWGHSIFGLTELKMEAGDEGESMLCMFCCTSYQHNKDIEKQRKAVLANDPHFTRFCEAALRQQRKRMSANTIIKSLNGLRKLSVCQRCFNKIGYAMGTKMAADEMEARVEELRRQLDNELKSLQSEVDQFYAEMKTIEEVIRQSDVSSLEGYLAGIEQSDEKEQSSVVLLLRDGIFAVMDDVELYCKRIKGQQIVVNTPQVRRKSEPRAATTPAKAKKTRERGKRKRGRKSKGGINPMMHVKVEHGPGEEADEEVSQAEDKGDAADEGDKGDGGRVRKRPSLEVETPRRQPKREARVRTEEFLKNLFEKQKAGEEELDTVVKTEVPSDAEDGAVEPGEPVPQQEDKQKEGDKTAEDDKVKVPEKSKEPAPAKEKGDDAGTKEPQEPAVIEEILIDGDDLEDLFYEDGETSDEDFHIDAAHDDLDTGSELSDSESEEGTEEEESEEEDEPKPKRPRGRPAGRRTKKSDFDPFNFKKKSRKSKAAKTRSTNKLAQMHNIDMSSMSDFRKRLLCRILKKNSKAPTDPLNSGEPDPRVNFRFEYSPENSTLVLGDVHVIIHDEHNSLQCSKCGYLSSPAEKPRRSVPRLMYNHILGKHLYAFQCPQCSATLGSYRRYLDHIKGHQMGFQCDICGKPLFSEEALRRHKWGHMNAEEMAEAISNGIKDPRRKHDPTQTFQCTTCGKVFSKKMLLRQHEKTHAENRERIVCTLCGKTFLPSGFISHQKYSCFPEGYEPPRVQCQLCPSTFKSVVLRARHMKYAHSSASIEKPFKCHLCGKGFAANEHLQKHIKRHSDARPYLCRKGCGANYKTRKDCTRHEKKCEGSGTPMMRHKGRNDSLSAAPTVKQEPGTTGSQPMPASQTVTITSVQGHIQTQAQGPSPPIIIQTVTQAPASGPPAATVQVQPQQFNVYNIL